MKTKKFSTILFLIFLGAFFSFQVINAVCPVCTVVVVGGLGISEWLGIDDFISALWIGGLALSLTIWCWNYLKKKNKLSFLSGLVVLLIMYLSVIYPLYVMKFLWIPGNTLWGIDKVILGIIIGTVLFWSGVFANHKLKKINGGKVYFPFQKVVLPFSFLLVVGVAYYLICKCF